MLHKDSSPVTQLYDSPRQGDCNSIEPIAYLGMYSRIPITRTSKGNENWFEKVIGGKITMQQILGKRKLVSEIGEKITEKPENYLGKRKLVRLRNREISEKVFKRSESSFADIKIDHCFSGADIDYY